MHSFAEAASLFEKHLGEIQLFDKEPNNLYEPCRYLLEAGGKRVRPALCLMSHELFSEWEDDGFNAAVALELFHNFTLIHDDIMDKAPLRRNQQTVHTKYGITTGILSGDVMNIYAYQQLSKINSNALKQILPLFNQTAIEVCEGQQWDFEFELKDEITLSEYLKMIELKTSVLIAVSLYIGAIIGGANEKEASALYAFGKNLGIAFQLKDDYLDVFGEQGLIGKQLGGDIVARKKTILYVQYMALAGNNDSLPKLKDIFTEERPDLVKRVTDLFREVEVDKAVLNRVGQYSNEALGFLDALELSDKKTEPLRDLFLQLMHRKS